MCQLKVSSKVDGGGMVRNFTSGAQPFNIISRELRSFIQLEHAAEQCPEAQRLAFDDTVITRVAAGGSCAPTAAGTQGVVLASQCSVRGQILQWGKSVWICGSQCSYANRQRSHQQFFSLAGCIMWICHSLLLVITNRWCYRKRNPYILRLLIK